VLLRDEAFDPLREQAQRSLRAAVDVRTRQEEVLLVLERLGRGAVRDPVLVVLVDVQHALGHDHDGAEDARDVHGDVEGRDHGDGGRSGQLERLQPLEALLALRALAVVPGDLVFEPLEGRVLLALGRDNGGKGLRRLGGRHL
jgi:hypothetical protein